MVGKSVGFEALVGLAKDREGYTYTRKTGPYYAPAVDFERGAGLRGLSAQWKVPGGMGHAEAEAALYPFINAVFDNHFQETGEFPIDWPVPREVLEQANAIVDGAFDHFLAINPELERLRPVCPDGLRKGVAILGIVSQFNADDIFFECSVSCDDWPIELRMRQEKLARRAGVPIQYWVLSEPTIVRACEQLDRRDEIRARLLETEEGPLRPLRMAVQVPVGWKKKL